MNVDPATLDTKAIAQYVSPANSRSTTEFLLNIIPTTVTDAFAKGDILQVLLFSILFGLALHTLGARGRRVFDVIDGLSRALFSVVGLIMKAAPLGAFGAMAFTVGNFGVTRLAQLGQLMACFYLTCLLFIFIVLNIITRAHGFRIWPFIKYIREELLIVLGTSSSESALPRLMVKLEELGVQRSVVALVVPAGYSFNLDGTAIYLSMATVFIAQATNTPLDVRQQITLLAVLLITSKGAAGVAGAALIVLAGTLSAVGHVPVAGVVLVLGIHRFMGEAISMTNLVGNGVATIVVGKWCNRLDAARLKERLAQGPLPGGAIDPVEKTTKQAVAG
jgi:aerobic C4-dicarboxylate transport protein